MAGRGSLAAYAACGSQVEWHCEFLAITLGSVLIADNSVLTADRA